MCIRDRYDGTHTWRVTQFTPNPENASQNTLEINDSNLIAGGSVGDYFTLEFANFSVVGGSPVPGGTATVDIGNAIKGIVLYDDGDMANHNDSSSNDGIYNTKFLVRESYQFNVENGSIAGYFTKNSNSATNQPFIAPEKISIDGIRPKIDLVNAYPNPYNPNIGLEQFFYYLSENCNISLNIFYNSVTIKTLNATGYFGYNEPILWDGFSNTGVMQTDGDFYYRFDYTDSAGNTGSSFIGLLKITTVELVTDIYSIDTEYSHTSENQVVVTLNTVSYTHLTLPTN